MNNKQVKNVCVPREVFNSMFEAYQKWEEFSDEFEDFLLASDKEFVDKMKKTRKAHLQGETKNLKTLKQELI